MLARSLIVLIGAILTAAALAPRLANAAEADAEPAGRATAAPVRTLLMDPAALVAWLEQRNPDIAAAAARVTQARSDVGTARLVPNPVVDLSLGNFTVGTTNPAGLGFSDLAIATVGLSETFELGKRGPRIASARLRQDASLRSYADAVVQKAAEARLALGRIVYLREKLRVLDESLRSATEALELERTRMQQGFTSGNDFDRLSLETLGLGIDLERARSDYEAALAACGAVLAASCDASATTERDLDAAAPVPEVPADGDGLVSTLRRRPDVRSLDLQRASALEDARLAGRRALPDPTLRAAFTYDRMTISGDQAKTFMFTLSFPLPVFDHGQHDAQRARGRAAELEQTARGTLEKARGDIVALQRRRSFLEAAVRTLTQSAVPKSRAVLDTTTAAFARGQVGMTDLLLARRTHIGLLVNLMDVRFDYLQTRNELRRLLGLDAEFVRGAAGRRL